MNQQVGLVTNARDAADLHRVLTEEVIPLFYDRDIDGLPRQWIRRMMNSISFGPSLVTITPAKLTNARGT